MNTVSMRFPLHVVRDSRWSNSERIWYIARSYSIADSAVLVSLTDRTHAPLSELDDLTKGWPDDITTVLP